ncbi:hypothetical protein [Elioraea sp.]|uniref:hypothetical protein n=1 Tax=Elioraea sp. TaxID=2185103 RepID=UPI0025BCCBF3|nr:hypothetical protein [Elioraea sp.]
MIVTGGRGLTQASDNCFILLDDGAGFANPVMMVGEIVRQSSQGRDNPPLCANGFDTAGTAFALGHIMALELGGCDVSENIVPQYGQWQGNANGAWRRMEKTLVDADTATRALQQVMVVVIDYDATTPMTTVAERTRFAMGEKLMHFTDPRIPTRFRVWAVPKAWAHGTAKMADFFAATLVAKQALFAPLAAALLAAQVPAIFNEAITTMPAIDREFWKGQTIQRAGDEAYDYFLEIAPSARSKKKFIDELAQTKSGGPIYRKNQYSDSPIPDGKRRSARDKPHQHVSLEVSKADFLSDSEIQKHLLSWIKEDSHVQKWPTQDLSLLKFQDIGKYCVSEKGKRGHKI